MDLLAGVTAGHIQTPRLNTFVYQSGPTDGEPVLMIHGNLATGRFFEHIMSRASDGYRFVAPDMRSFGRSESAPIDATRGLRDWADDAAAVLDVLGIDDPPHLVGWSTGGAAVAAYAMDRAAASLTLIDPVSPFGYGGTYPDGTPCAPDWAGTGGGTGNPDFAALIAGNDRSADSDLSPRNVMNSSYWSAEFRLPPDREDILLDEVLLSVTGDDGYPGDMTPSDNWPGVAPGTRGILNALSGKYCSWNDIVDLEPKPPVLWTHGSDDIVVSDASPWEMGTLGQLEMVPGWPGIDVFPPQQMVGQIRNVLTAYADRGGRVQMEMMEGSGHGPHIDSADAWSETFFGFLDSV